MFSQNNCVVARAEPRPYLQPVKVVVRFFIKRDAGVVAGGEVAGGLDVARGKGFPLAGRPWAVPAYDAADFAGREFDESFHVGLQKKRARASNEETARRFALRTAVRLRWLIGVVGGSSKDKKISQSLLSASDNLEVE